MLEIKYIMNKIKLKISFFCTILQPIITMNYSFMNYATIPGRVNIEGILKGTSLNPFQPFLRRSWREGPVILRGETAGRGG